MKIDFANSVTDFIFAFDEDANVSVTCINVYVPAIIFFNIQNSTNILRI